MDAAFAVDAAGREVRRREGLHERRADRARRGIALAREQRLRAERTAEERLVGHPYIEAIVIAILLGTAIRTLWEPGPRWRAGIAFSAKQLLEIAVALLGASLTFAAIALAPTPARAQFPCQNGRYSMYSPGSLGVPADVRVQCTGSGFVMDVQWPFVPEAAVLHAAERRLGQFHFDAPGMGVFEDVGKAFLCYPVQGRLDVVRDAALNPQLRRHLEAGLAHGFVHEMLERARQPKLLERGRPQLVRQFTHLLDAVRHKGLQANEIGLLASAGLSLQGFEAHQERGQGLAGAIVELGPGVGVMTKALLARMRPTSKLYTIEIDAPPQFATASVLPSGDTAG